MKHHLSTATRCWARWLGGTLAAVVLSVHGHGVRSGHLRVDHPYALPTAGPAAPGAVYFRGLHNGATVPDRLLGASTPRAAEVHIHHMQMEGDVMRMRAVQTLTLPAQSALPWRHGSKDGYHLMLTGLTAPLKDGDRFPITLRFERAGPIEAMVWVQTPKSAGSQVHHTHTPDKP